MEWLEILRDRGSREARREMSHQWRVILRDLNIASMICSWIRKIVSQGNKGYTSYSTVESLVAIIAYSRMFPPPKLQEHKFSTPLHLY